MAWSYAALRHLGLETGVVFHDGGYQSNPRTLIEQFESGRYVAVPLLQWLGLAADDAPPPDPVRLTLVAGDTVVDRR